MVAQVNGAPYGVENPIRSASDTRGAERAFPGLIIIPQTYNFSIVGTNTVVYRVNTATHDVEISTWSS